MELLEISSLKSSLDIVSTTTRLFGACLACFILASFYKYTHSGISYSSNFSFTIVVCGLLAAGVIITVGENIARAFALVGALAIIRYRTVIKDPKDLSFIFASLVIGMAVGTGLYATAVIIQVIFVAVALIVRYGDSFSFAADFNSIVRVKGTANLDLSMLEKELKAVCRNYQVLTFELDKTDETAHAVFELHVKSSSVAMEVTERLKAVDGSESVSFISGNNSVTY
jgi:uncharacterized membrane protein YhiD involved in acid resistance